MIRVPSCPSVSTRWVNRDKTQIEQNESALPLKADIGADINFGRQVSIASKAGEAAANAGSLRDGVTAFLAFRIKKRTLAGTVLLRPVLFM